jgi:transcriptional regulator with XRE-family HTH domain
VTNPIAERLRDAVAGRNQSDLARELHRSRSAITQWKNGKTEPDLGTLADLCRTLGISADWLLGLPIGGPNAVQVDELNAKLAQLEAENARLRSELAQANVDLRAAERALATSLTETVIAAAREAAAVVAGETAGAVKVKGGRR